MEAIKKELMLEFDANQDEEIISYMLAWIKFQGRDDRFALSKELKDRIAIGRAQKENGQTISHENAMAQLQAWLNSK